MFENKDKHPKTPGLQTKEWFIIIDNRQEGPYSLQDLDDDPRFTPDTLVWKEGFKEWVQARFVLEMKEVFKDKSTQHHDDKDENLKTDLGKQEQITLTLRQDPYQFFLWILILLLLLFYIFYQFYYR